jgi:hypothetical protein
MDFSFQEAKEKQDFLVKEVEALFSDWQQEGKRIESVIDAEGKRHEAMKAELSRLESSFPDLLAGFALSEVEKSEIAKVRKRCAELEMNIRDFSSLQTGLNHRQAAYRGRGRRIAQVKNLIEKCSKILDDLGNTVDKDYLVAMEKDLQDSWIEVGKRLGELKS